MTTLKPDATPVTTEATAASLVERLEANATLQEQWDRWELNGPAPEALFHKDTAALQREAAATITRLSAELAERTEPLSNDRLMELWRLYDGTQHGPHTETVTMPLASFPAFAAAIRSLQEQK